MAALDADGAVLEVLDGEVRAHVIPRTGGVWTFVAGPYAVRVVGTRFDVAWDEPGGRFGLALHDGAVYASGPLLGEGRTVVAGELVDTWVHERRLELRAGDPARLLVGAAFPLLPAAVRAGEDVLPDARRRRAPGGRR